jgi:hypothetical protein
MAAERIPASAKPGLGAKDCPAPFETDGWTEVAEKLRDLNSAEAVVVCFASSWHPTGVALGRLAAQGREDHAFSCDVYVVDAEDEASPAGKALLSLGGAAPPAVAAFVGTDGAAAPIELLSGDLPPRSCSECACLCSQIVSRQAGMARVTRCFALCFPSVSQCLDAQQWRS